MKKWNIASPSQETVNSLCQSGIDPLAAHLLAARGYETVSQASDFLQGGETLSDPYLLLDMDKAVERISEAVEYGQRICIYGDYDCDGVTSTAVLYSYLDSIGANVMYYIPERSDGYGLNEEAIRKPYFYISMAAVFLTGMTLQGLSGIATPHMYDIGMSKAFVANLTSVGSLVFCCTKFLMGWSYDRFGIKLPLFVGLGSAMFSTVSIIFLTNTPAGQAVAWIRMPINNLAMPLETVMLPILASEFFGDKSFDKIVGCYAAANYAGFAIGSPFGNVCYDIFGDYKLAFAVFTILMAVVVVMQCSALKQSRKEMARAQAQLPIEE